MNDGYLDFVSKDIKRNKGNTRATMHQISFSTIQVFTEIHLDGSVFH